MEQSLERAMIDVLFLDDVPSPNDVFCRCPMSYFLPSFQLFLQSSRTSLSSSCLCGKGNKGRGGLDCYQPMMFLEAHPTRKLVPNFPKKKCLCVTTLCKVISHNGALVRHPSVEESENLGINQHTGGIRYTQAMFNIASWKLLIVYGIHWR